MEVQRTTGRRTRGGFITNCKAELETWKLGHRRYNALSRSLEAIKSIWAEAGANQWNGIKWNLNKHRDFGIIREYRRRIIHLFPTGERMSVIVYLIPKIRSKIHFSKSRIAHARGSMGGRKQSWNVDKNAKLFFANLPPPLRNHSRVEHHFHSGNFSFVSSLDRGARRLRFEAFRPTRSG